MKSNYIQPDFKGQTFYIGLDIHSKSWAVCIRIQRVVAERFTMNPSPEELLEHLRKKYPGGRYKSVYEAGFSGFWIHRRLTELGYWGRTESAGVSRKETGGASPLHVSSV